VGRLFGTNGVRGVVNQEFTVELAQGLAASAGSLLGKEMAVGRDARTSSPMVRDAVVSGLLSSPRYREWRLPAGTWLVGIGGIFGYHFLIFTSFKYAPVVEANLLNYL